MPSIPVEAFMAGVLGDEGWQSPLDEASVAAVIARLEDLLPPDSALAPAEAERLRASLRELAAMASALARGELDEPRLVAGILAMWGR